MILKTESKESDHEEQEQDAQLDDSTPSVDREFHGLIRFESTHDNANDDAAHNGMSVKRLESGGRLQTGG